MSMETISRPEYTEAFASLALRLERIEKLALIGAKKFLTLDEAIIITDLSKGYLYRLTSELKIPHYKPGGRLYFRKDELEDWLSRTRISTLEELNAKATTYTAINKL